MKSSVSRTKSPPNSLMPSPHISADFNPYLSRSPESVAATFEAYLSYLHGRALLGRFTVAESEAAVPHFEKALELDPRFAAAYASLYDAHMQAAAQRRLSRDSVRRRYQPLIDQALAIDPQSGAAYFARAMWSVETTEARDMDYRRGVELDPSNGRGLTAYSEFLQSEAHQWEASGRMLQRALWVDPMSPRARFKEAMRSLQDSGAIVLERKMLEVLELDPTFVPALQRYGKYRWEHHGLLTEAVQVIERAIALDPANPWLRHTAMAIYLDLGDEAAARDVSAGTPQNVASSRLLLSLYRGDWRAAGLAAYDKESWSYNVFENWGASEALRDYALKTGELDKAIRFLQEKYALSADSSVPLLLDNFRQAVFLSQLLEAQGHTSQALELRRAASRWNDGTSRSMVPYLRGDCARDCSCSKASERLRLGSWPSHSVPLTTCNGGTQSRLIHCGSRCIKNQNFAPSPRTYSAMSQDSAPNSKCSAVAAISAATSSKTTGLGHGDFAGWEHPVLGN